MSEQSEITGPLVKMLRQMGIFTLRLNSGKVRVRGGWTMYAECEIMTYEKKTILPSLR